MTIEFKFTDNYVTMIYNTGESKTILHVQESISPKICDNITDILRQINIENVQ